MNIAVIGVGFVGSAVAEFLESHMVKSVVILYLLISHWL